MLRIPIEITIVVIGFLLIAATILFAGGVFSAAQNECEVVAPPDCRRATIQKYKQECHCQTLDNRYEIRWKP